MPDKMKEIQRLLKNNPPPDPSKWTKLQVVDEAVAEFEKKNAIRSQGFGMGRRLMGAVKTVNPMDGGRMKTTYKVAGGLAFASLAAMLLTSTSLKNDLMPPADVIAKQEHKVENSVAPVDAVAPPALPADKNVPLPSGQLQPVPMTAEPAKAAEADSRARVESEVANVAPAPLQEGPALAAPMAPPPAALAAPSMDMVQTKSVSVGKGAGIMGGATAQHAERKMANFAGSAGIIAPEPYPQHPVYKDEGRDTFEKAKTNTIKQVKSEPVSTFSVDVDTASYSFVRSSLNSGVLPPKDAVRVEEMVNYFPYDYAPSKDKSVPFASTVNVMPTPWNKGTKLIHIGIKGYDLQPDSKPRANLVFLIDTSGSMNAPNKLPLLKNSMKLLLESMQPEDTVSIVTYAGSAGTALEPTRVKDKGKILSALESLNSGGSTAGAEGIRQAYTLAERNFDPKGINRVILATDGDFNVGITDPNELKGFVERKRDTGVTLSVLGFGQGNYNDALMQTLAQNGNGNASYIDSLNEARKVLVDESTSTLFTIAKDVKLQVEFNPAKVAEYRLVGYETRMLNREDFNNDKVDAGDIGAGHTVTAIYEITPVGSGAISVDPLRYANGAEPKEQKAANGSDEYAFLKIRYKLPKENASKLITTPIDEKREVATIAAAPNEARFAAAVAGFGQLLRGDSYIQSYSYDDVIALAQAAKGTDPYGYRSEFINLVRNAKLTAGSANPQPQPAVAE